eukprot:2422036-Karenia_brevis.AAC.1
MLDKSSHEAKKNIVYTIWDKEWTLLAELEKHHITDLKFVEGSGVEAIHDAWMTHDGRHRAIIKR